MALTKEQLNADVLSKAEQYGVARGEFAKTLAQAAQVREQAMYNLGADFTTQGGDVLSPTQAAEALGKDPEKFGRTTKMTTGFTTTGRGLGGIQQEQTAAVYEADVAAQERGITAGSGTREQSRLLTREAGDVERQKLIQDTQAQIAGAEGEVVAAKGAVESAEAGLATARGRRANRRKKQQGKKPKPVAKPVNGKADTAKTSGAKARAAKARADKKKKKGR